MSPTLLPSNETDRLAALRSYEVLDTANEEVFDDLVSLAARLTGSPIALMSLVDAERQWFKACYGLHTTEMPREIAFCSHTILDPLHPLIIEDAAVDPRFMANPLVTGEPTVRAYLGVPLVNPDGYALGSLCVIDRLPRTFDTETINAVRTLGRAVTVHLELRRSLRRMSEMAFTDPLTGLPNRRAVMSRLAETIEQGRPLSVITVDLDHFKEINDGEGHAAGDVLLQVTAGRLCEAVRPGDMVGRIGGDEFVVLLIGLSDRDVASEIAQRISTTLPRLVPYGTRLLRLGATLGVAVVPGDAEEPEIIMRIADDALIRAKRDARGSVGCASREDATRLQRTAAIVRAFDADTDENDAIRSATVHFQPIVTLDCVSATDAGATGAGSTSAGVIALEALARWTHPDVGEVPPGDLFPVIGPDRAARLGRAVREQALAAFASLQVDGLAGVRVALNLSASEVARVDIALHIAEQVERAGLSLRAVEIEITEEVLLDRVSDRTLDQLAALRGRGARLVLDDFGTGNSGLAQLLRLPLDGVKLDKQFIHRLGHDIRAEEIVRATVSLAHSLGLEVVAEGVETEHQMTMLRDLGCDAVQGFLLARPMTTASLKAWLYQRTVDRIPNLVALKPSPRTTLREIPPGRGYARPAPPA